MRILYLRILARGVTTALSRNEVIAIAVARVRARGLIQVGHFEQPWRLERDQLIETARLM